MKELSRRWFVGAAGAGLVAACGLGTASAAQVFGEFVMPGLRVEVAPPPPRPGWHWVPGHWMWRGGWVWNPGHYVAYAVPPMPPVIVETPPPPRRPSWHWVRGHLVWSDRARNWVWNSGHWVP